MQRPSSAPPGVLREDFRWLRGQEKLSSYQLSPGKLRHFCATCGSQLIAPRTGQAHLIVRVATLDKAPGARPAQHIWTSHDRPWLTCGELPTYAEWQPGH